MVRCDPLEFNSEAPPRLTSLAASTVASPRVRILHIIVGLGFGGAERLVVSAATRLPPSEFESVICCLAERGPLADEAEGAGIRVESIGAFPGLSHPIALLRLFRLIKALRPDVVHTHLQAANLYGRFAAWLAGVPIIVASEHNVYTSKAPRYVAVERLLARRTGALIAVSEQVRRFLSGQLRIEPSAIRLIRNGVARRTPSGDRVADLGRRLSVPDDAALLGVVASLTPKKGHEHLLRAMALLLDRGVPCALVLAGDGPERPRLESLTNTLRLSPAVHFLGATRHVEDVLALIDVFVLPSLVEGLPLALLEAMQAGIPVVATSVGGVPEVVTAGVNGVLVPAGSAEALADAIGPLIGSAALRKEYGDRARATVEQRFTEQHYVDALAALYRELSVRLKPDTTGAGSERGQSGVRPGSDPGRAPPR
jgi:L-malate glycosyltransferase